MDQIVNEEKTNVLYLGNKQEHLFLFQENITKILRIFASGLKKLYKWKKSLPFKTRLEIMNALH